MILSDFVVEINKWKDYCGVIVTSLYANWDQSIYLNHVKKRKKKIFNTKCLNHVYPCYRQRVTVINQNNVYLLS